MAKALAAMASTSGGNRKGNCKAWGGRAKEAGNAASKGAGGRQRGATGHGGKGGEYCACCGFTGHVKSSCPHLHKNCKTCGKQGHLAATCRSTPLPSPDSQPSPKRTLCEILGGSMAWRCENRDCRHWHSKEDLKKCVICNQPRTKDQQVTKERKNPFMNGKQSEELLGRLAPGAGDEDIEMVSHPLPANIAKAELDRKRLQQTLETLENLGDQDKAIEKIKAELAKLPAPHLPEIQPLKDAVGLASIQAHQADKYHGMVARNAAKTEELKGELVEREAMKEQELQKAAEAYEAMVLAINRQHDADVKRVEGKITHLQDELASIEADYAAACSMTAAALDKAASAQPSPAPTPPPQATPTPAATAEVVREELAAMPGCAGMTPEQLASLVDWLAGRGLLAAPLEVGANDWALVKGGKKGKGKAPPALTDGGSQNANGRGGRSRSR